MTLKTALPRGLVEVSNECQKNCLYCGIRRGNSSLLRYRMSEHEVLDLADEAIRRGYPAIALQAGEIESEANTAFYERILRALPEGLEVTLSLGEQTRETYARWKAAAGSRVLRYLLRIETSNKALYAKIHPAECSFERRVAAIRDLKDLGYVTGSGVMIGIPGQTKSDLKADLDFFEEMKLDMVGMGPYVPVEGAPMPPCTSSNEERLELSLWMIREVRRRMPHVNIVAATALDAIAPHGREAALKAGANVVMPVMTPEKYAKAYALYPGK